MPARRQPVAAETSVSPRRPAPIRDITRFITERVDVVYEGKPWPVIFTHAALLEIEEVGGLNLLADGVSLLRPSASLQRAALYVVLRRAGAECSLEAAGRILGTAQMGPIQRALAAGWRAAMPAPEPDIDGQKRAESMSWIEIWADHRFNLGLRDEEWLNMTPRMVQALAKQRLEAMRMHELMLGKVAEAAANFGGSAPKKWLPARDFMLHPWPKKPSAGIDLDRLSAYFKAFRTDGETIQ